MGGGVDFLMCNVRMSRRAWPCMGLHLLRCTRGDNAGVRRMVVRDQLPVCSCLMVWACLVLHDSKLFLQCHMTFAFNHNFSFHHMQHSTSIFVRQWQSPLEAEVTAPFCLTFLVGLEILYRCFIGAKFARVHELLHHLAQRNYCTNGR
jgi:hypothetical protein